MNVRRVDIKKADECCGCTACLNICPTKAISMVDDAIFGFQCPKIDEDICIKCGLCYKVCDFSSGYDKSSKLAKPLVYGLRNADEEKLVSSQSGGAFISIAKPFLGKNGVVYGVIYGENYHIKHIRATTLAEVEQMHGSKYVQSDINGIIKQIECDIDSGLSVLFVGTPCQVAGVKSYFRHKRKSRHLFTIDILCHGVGAPHVWRDNLEYVRKKLGGELTYVNMREPSMGWHDAKEKYCSDSKTHIQHTYLDLYFGHYIHRDSCFNCPFTNTIRVGDISIGDFWGWEKHYKEFNDEKGVSVVLINSEKGKELFESIEPSEVILRESSIEKAMQNVLDHPVKPNRNLTQFLHDYRSKGYKCVIYKYGDRNYSRRIKTLLYPVKIAVTNLFNR